MSDLILSVCRMYPDTFAGVESMEAGPLPIGWRRLMLAFLGDIHAALGPTPPHKVAILRIVTDDGLRIVHDLRPLPGDGEPTAMVVAAIVAAAERRSLEVCDQCSGPGMLRQNANGVRMVRCDRHMEIGPPVPPRRLEPAHILRDMAGGAGLGTPTSDFTRRACLALSGEIQDLTEREEVPVGWRSVCWHLLIDVAAMMTGAQHRRLGLRRLHADGETLGWEVSTPRSVPGIVQRGIDIAFLRAAEDAAITCRSCGRRHGGDLEDATTCSCGAVWPPRTSDARRAPVITLPALPPGIPGRTLKYLRSAKRQRRTPAEPRRSDARIPLYRRKDVAASLGLVTVGSEGPNLVVIGEAGDTEQQVRLQALLDRGDEARFRRLAPPTSGAIDAVAALIGVAPNLSTAIDHVVRHLRAAATIGLPMSLPPTLLLGPPGTGKTWFATRLSALLGLPHRLVPMNLFSTGDAISGAHPTWRNSAPGIVAKALLAEDVANVLLFADELDKPRFHNGFDPYNAFYTLLEPIGATSFVDEYYGVAFDASRLLWIASANDLAPIPEPILNRLTIIDVPMPSADHLAAIIDSVYADANLARHGFFTPRLDPSLRDRLADQPPRSIRVMVEDAMVRAAADGRRSISDSDLKERRRGAATPIGFVRPDRRGD